MIIPFAVFTAAFLTAPAQQPSSEFRLTDEVKSQTIEALLSALDESYVFPEKATEAGKAIRAKAAAGDYKSISDPTAFAQKLREDTNAVLADAHFRIRFSAAKLPERVERREPSEEEVNARISQIRQTNAGYEKVERLTGNIGYMELRQFAQADYVPRPAAAAFNFVSETDALIIDLRRNGGGDPSAVQLFCSYLFGETPVHLNSIYFRPTNETTEFWTLKDLDGPRYVDKPVYVLTSSRTGSGAEECAYNLKNLKRAIIVGEVTWGGANPGGTVRLNDHFDAFIPVGRAINPITKTNWEGVGVQPDVACPADEALVRAQIMILEERARVAPKEEVEGIRNRIAELQKELAPSMAQVEAVISRISIGY